LDFAIPQHKIAYDIEQLRDAISKYTTEIGNNNRFKGFLSRNKFRLKAYTISGLRIYSVSNISNIVFDYCCHPKSGDEIMGFLEKGRVHVHHKMCANAAKKLESHEAMVFVKWMEENIYHYNLIVSLHNEKGALANFLLYLVKLNIDINSIELGKDKSNYVKYCEIGFETKDSDMPTLRSKLEQKIKVIHIIRTDDAYKN